MVDPTQIDRYLSTLFKYVDWDGTLISLLGVGEKGTPKEGVLRDRVFVDPEQMNLVPMHLSRWAQYHGGSFIVPCVVAEAARDERDVKLDKVAAMVAIILDLDSGDVDAKIDFVSQRLGPPSMIVQSGGLTDAGATKRHLYWMLSEPSDEIDRIASLRKTLALKSGGDPSFGRATQVIRVPGSVHAKHGKTSVCALLECNDRDYDLDDLAEIIEGMEPMPGLPMPAAPTSLLPFGPNGGMDFSGGAGLEHQSALTTMLRDVHEGGDDEANRWTSFNQVAGFNIQQIRLGQMDVAEAMAATRGWMLAHMRPPWPEQRFATEFHALYNKDVADRGVMPHILEQQQAAAAQTDAIKIKATSFVWRDPSNIPARPWVYGRWLLRNTVTAMVAPGGVGKSSTIASMALSLASGKNIMGRDVWGGPQHVWYWNLEDDGDELSRQFHAAAIHHEVEPADLDNRLMVDSGPDGARLCTASDDKNGFSIRRPVMDALTSELISRGIDALIVDPFVSSHEVDENDNSKIDAVVKEWASVAKAANCAVMLVHHSKKLEGRRVTSEASRGASSLIAAARIVLVLNRMDDEQASFYDIPSHERARYFSVGDDKHNRSPAAAADWFRLHSVPLGNGDDMGVVAPWQPPSVMDGLSIEKTQEIMRVLAAGTYRKQSRGDDWAGIVIARILHLDSSDKGERTKIDQIMTKWITSGMLEVYQARDKSRQMRPHVRPTQMAQLPEPQEEDDDNDRCHNF